MNGIVPVPEDDGVTSSTPDSFVVSCNIHSDCVRGIRHVSDEDLSKTIHMQFQPQYVYTVWRVHATGRGAVEIMQGTDREYLLRAARSMSAEKTDVVVTRQEIVLDLRRPVPFGPPHKCDTCGEPATACYRDGSPGHSEHVCACETHSQRGFEGLKKVIGD